MSPNIYHINFGKLIAAHLPGILRKNRRMAFLAILIKPVKSLYDAFISWRADRLYLMRHNSQAIYIRKVLNDRFDPVQRGIKVANSPVLEPVWHFDTVDNRPVYYFDTSDNKPVYFRDPADFLELNADFEVIVPLRLKPADATDLNDFEIRLRTLVDYYKLYSKKYNIKYQ